MSNLLVSARLVGSGKPHAPANVILYQYLENELAISIRVC